jgi:hypothetical protein
VKNNGGNLYILTAAVLGLTVGLFASLVLWPARSAEISPRELSLDGQNSYRVLIARAYAANGDNGRAASRLSLLDAGGSPAALSAQAQQALAAGRPQEEAEALARLAAGLVGDETGASPTFSPSFTVQPAGSATPEPTLSPTALPPTETAVPTTAPSATATSTATATAVSTATAIPPSHTPVPATPVKSATPPPASGSHFTLVERSTECDRALERLLRVEIQDSRGNPFPGQGIEISWQDGMQVFYTGLKPRAGSGYADFLLQPGGIYNIRLVAGSETVAGLAAPQCRAADGSLYEGSVKVVFREK